MNRILRQAFGTTRPKEIFNSLLTFDRLVTRPIVHIVYWVGLGLFFLAAMAVLGVAVGSALHDSSPMAWLLSLPVLVGGWLGILVGILIWRAACEFYMAVLSIAEDLHILRTYQEKLEPRPTAEQVAAPRPVAQAPVAQAAPVGQPAAPVSFAPPAFTPKVDPMSFDVPEPDAYAPVVDKETGNILEDPFFRPRFGKKE